MKIDSSLDLIIKHFLTRVSDTSLWLYTSLSPLKEWAHLSFRMSYCHPFFSLSSLSFVDFPFIEIRYMTHEAVPTALPTLYTTCDFMASDLTNLFWLKKQNTIPFKQLWVFKKSAIFYLLALYCTAQADARVQHARYMWAFYSFITPCV